MCAGVPVGVSYLTAVALPFFFRRCRGMRGLIWAEMRSPVARVDGQVQQGIGVVALHLGFGEAQLDEHGAVELGVFEGAVAPCECDGFVDGGFLGDFREVLGS